MFEYIKEYYGVSVCLGQVINYNGDSGLIVEDRGHYIGVTFDKDKPGDVVSVHPSDDNLEYTDKTRKIRGMTRSQKNYQEYLRSEVDCSFGEWMGFA